MRQWSFGAGSGVLVGFAAPEDELVTAAVDERAAAGVPVWRAAETARVRALLRRLLAEVTGEHATVVVAARPGGQPYLPELPEVAVSLAHDAGYVAAAVGTGTAVGVDVQAPAPVTPALVRRCCGPEVAAELLTMPPAVRDAEFARIWTVQEACVKATGDGLAGRPWTVPVGLGERSGRWKGHRWHSVSGTPVPVSVAYREEAR